MGNLTWLSNDDNLAARPGVGVSVLTAATAYPKANLITLPISKPWRSDGIAFTGEWILLDFGTALAVDLIGLVNHNLSDGAVIVVTAGSTAACADYTANPAAAWRERDAFTLLAASWSYRFWKIAITDQGNTDGYISLGYLVLGDSTTLAGNFSYGWSIGYEAENVEHESDAGVLSVAELFYRRRLSLPFRNLATAYVAQLVTLFEGLKRNAIPVFAVPDSEANEGYFGRFVGQIRRSYPNYYAYQDMDLEFVEDSIGRATVEAQPIDWDALESIAAATFTRTGVAWQTDETMDIDAVATQVARDAHYPVQGSPSLLLEGARTNAWTYSEDLDNAAWTKTRCSIGSSQLAPDGAMTADQLVEDNSLDTHYLYRLTPAHTANMFQSLSFFAKAGTRTSLCIRTTHKDGTTALSYVNLATGAAGTTAAGHTMRIVPYINSWYRIELSWDTLAGATAPEIIIFMAIAEAVLYQGDGASYLALWGIQFEVDVRPPSSYIPTVAGTVSHGQELFYFDMTADPAPMTIYLRYMELGTIKTNSLGLCYLGLAAGTGARLGVYVNAGVYRAHYDNGVSGVTSDAAEAPVVGDTVEVRVTLRANGQLQIHQSLNGAAETSGAETGALILPAAWGDDRFYLNSIGSGLSGFAAFHKVRILYGIQTRATCRLA